MNKYMKNLNRIEFVVTMACTGRCRHCSEGEHISKGEHIDGEVAAKAVRDICESYAIESIMTFGGEPLLHPEVVCKIHAAAKESGIPKRDLITNGFFSKDKRLSNRRNIVGRGNEIDIMSSLPLKLKHYFSKAGNAYFLA